MPGFRRDVEEAWVLLEQLVSRCSASLLGDEVHSAWEAEHLNVPGTSTAGSQQQQQQQPALSEAFVLQLERELATRNAQRMLLLPGHAPAMCLPPKFPSSSALVCRNCFDEQCY